MMKNNSIVTIGLCVRNSAKTIAKTIKSIVDLDFPKDQFSLTVVDGHSTDGTMEIIKNGLKNSSVNVLFLSDEGKGLAYARQIVVDNSKEKYVVWVDGDNVLPPNFLKSHVDYMEKNPEVGVSGARIVPCGDTIVARVQGYQWIIPVIDRKNEGYLMGKIGMQGTICKNEAINSVGGLNLCIKGAGEDVDLFIRMKLAGWKIGSTVDTKIYHYMRDSWSGLWKESVWWGNAEYYLSTEFKPCYPSMKRRAGLSILECIKITFKSFKLTKDLACVVMPLHYGLRRLGFFVGYLQARRKAKK